MRLRHVLSIPPLAHLLLVATCSAQATTQKAAADPAELIQLATSGRCEEALPRIRKIAPAALDKQVRLDLGLARVRCAARSNEFDEATTALSTLRREFPTNPAVLFLAVHVHSDLSIRASQELLVRAPDSAEVHQLNAEALEMQGKWKEAREQYRAALSKNPNTPGIHYRMGRLLLSEPKTETTMEEARKEFEAELAINPANVGSEFVLGEMARQAENLPVAIEHLTRATKLDGGFAEALIGLGQALLAGDRAADAVPVLERAALVQPDNPATHFHLANAYRRSGRKADADREMLAHKSATEKARQTADTIQRGAAILAQ
jgi:tetratricopeptide (TPR) repeat protein